MLNDEHIRCERVSYTRRRLKLPLFMLLTDDNVNAVRKAVLKVPGVSMARITASGKAVIVKVKWKKLKEGQSQFEERLKTTAKQALISSVSNTEMEATPQQSRSTRTKRSEKRSPNKRQQPRRSGQPTAVVTT
jgi:hypothetical protein